jgi:hypothetical protein
MPIELNVPFIYPHTCLRKGTQEYTPAQLLGAAVTGQTAPEILVIFRAEGLDNAVFTWEVEGIPLHAGEAPKQFETSLKKLNAFYDSVKIPKNLRPDWLFEPIEGSRFWAARLRIDQVMRFVIGVETEKPEISDLVVMVQEIRRCKRLADLGDFVAMEDLARARDMIRDPFRRAFPPLTVSLFGVRENQNDVSEFDRQYILQIKPDLDDTPGYPGYVGIDFGNTGTTLAYMPEEEDDVKAVQLFTLDVISGREALPTAIRVKKLTSRATAREELLLVAEWEIGQKAIRDGTPGALILGAKRLLADPGGTPHRVWLDGGGNQEMPKSLPAELFLTSVIKEFQCRHQHGDLAHGWHVHGPRRGHPGLRTMGLAVTHPTTFTDREIAALNRTVSAGWLRATGTPVQNDESQPGYKAVELVIDEASAAGMYFIFRDFLRGPGFARSLWFLYPHGVNLLVYDCGGGTTDIALVHVLPVYDAANERVASLQVDVIGRGGHRSFGGDDVTIAVFQLVKAKIAVWVAGKLADKNDRTKPANHLPDELVGVQDALSGDLSKLPAALATARPAIEELVPTNFDRNAVGEQNVRIRAAAVLQLWTLVEQLKHRLEIDEKAQLNSPITATGFVGYLVATHHMRLQSHKPGEMIRDIRVSRAEVNSLIQADVLATVDRANDLIRRKLGNGDRDRPDEPATERARAIGEVHKVYVLGNASKYPLVCETLAKELEVRFLMDNNEGSEVTPGRLVFAPTELKGAVAKGAAIALRMQHELDGVNVFVDDALSRRLLFDVWFSDYGDAPVRLYREGELYADLAPKVIAPPVSSGITGFIPQIKSKVARLKRKWPGEKEQTTYLTFTFRQPWVGPLLVQYVPEKGPAFDDATPAPYFMMTDQGNGERVIGHEESQTVYVSPPQSGLL